MCGGWVGGWGGVGGGGQLVFCNGQQQRGVHVICPAASVTTQICSTSRWTTTTTHGLGLGAPLNATMIADMLSLEPRARHS